MNKKLKLKRMIKISSIVLFLLVIFNLAGMNGLWIDTRVIATNIGLPEFFGSIWFNLLTIGFTISSVQMLSTRNPNNIVPIREFAIGVSIFVSALAPFIGLLVPLGLIVSWITAIAIIIMVIGGILWISEFRALGTVKKRFYVWKHKIIDFLWN